MGLRSEPKCHICGLHTEVCALVEALQVVTQKVTLGNFQVHLAVATATRILDHLTLRAVA